MFLINTYIMFSVLSLQYRSFTDIRFAMYIRAIMIPVTMYSFRDVIGRNIDLEEY